MSTPTGVKTGRIKEDDNSAKKKFFWKKKKKKPSTVTLPSRNLDWLRINASHFTASCYYTSCIKRLKRLSRLLCACVSTNLCHQTLNASVLFSVFIRDAKVVLRRLWRLQRKNGHCHFVHIKEERFTSERFSCMFLVISSCLADAW